MPTTGERLVGRLRAETKRFFAPNIARRHGWVYVWLRVVEDRLSRLFPLRESSARFSFVGVRGGTGGDPRVAVSPARPAQVISVPDVVDLDPWLHDLPGWGRSHHVPAQVTVEIASGFVFGNEGWVGPSSDTIVVDLGNAYPATPDRTAAAAASGLALAHGIEGLDGTVVPLLQLGWANYYHWMLQGLPRLSLVLEALGGPDAIDTLPAGPQIPGFVLDTLQRVGVRPEQLRAVDPPVPVFRCERLVAASMLPIDLPPPAWATEFVRNLFRDSLDPTPGSLLYVQRGPRARRRVLNEADVIGLLARHGFEVCDMAGRTLAEQAALFSGARCIVAPHGAALSNLVFATSGATLIELLPANTPSAMFSLLARQRGLGYAVVVGSEPRPPRLFRTWIGDADLVVDVAQLERAVLRLLG